MNQLIVGLYEDWLWLDERIDQITSEIEEIGKRDSDCNRLMTVPGIGPVISTAIVAAIGQADPLEHRAHTMSDLAAGYAVELREDREIFTGREVGVDGEILGDDADLGPRAARSQPVAGEANLPGVESHATGDRANHRRLPGAVGAENRHELARLHFEGQPVQGGCSSP